MRETNCKFDLERRYWLERIAGGALGASVALATAPFMVRQALAADALAEGIYRASGEISINNKPAAIGAVVRPGDLITTADNASAVFVVGKNAHLIRGGSRVEFHGADLAAKAMRVLTGKLLSVFGKGEMKISTATATIGIRGTGAYIEAEADLTYICTCYGIAELQAHDNPDAKEIVKTIHHDAPRYVRAGKSGAVILPAPVFNHTDQELIMLEALVGRVPPFVGMPWLTPY